jgi:hypothetical protein
MPSMYGGNGTISGATIGSTGVVSLSQPILLQPSHHQQMPLSLPSNDPILRGGAGLHRCEVCECCMTAGAMAEMARANTSRLIKANLDQIATINVVVLLGVGTIRAIDLQ